MRVDEEGLGLVGWDGNGDENGDGDEGLCCCFYIDEDNVAGLILVWYWFVR